MSKLQVIYGYVDRQDQVKSMVLGYILAYILSEVGQWELFCSAVT